MKRRGLETYCALVALALSGEISSADVQTDSRPYKEPGGRQILPKPNYGLVVFTGVFGLTVGVLGTAIVYESVRASRLTRSRKILEEVVEGLKSSS